MASSEREAGGEREEAQREKEDAESAQVDSHGEELQSQSSPQLSRRALDELGQLQTDPADPDNYPLHSAWAFWFERSQKGGTASDFFANLRQIHVVGTIKAFWCVFNNLSPVDQLRERESYHLMRDTERRPVWEDELNAHGGMWSFRVKKEDTAAVWQEVILAAIGEQFLESMETGDDVCGVSVRIRRFDHNIIQIWNMDSEQHSKSSVIQRVKELIPTIEINEFYQSNRSKMEESLRKPPYGHRRFSPPPVAGPAHRFPGGMHPHFNPFSPGTSGAPRYPPLPRYRHPPPPHFHGQRFHRPYPSPP